AGEVKRVVIVGGGFGGAYAAQTLAKKRRSDLEVVLIDRQNFLLFYPLLIEAGVGNLEPRHVTVPIRQFLNKNVQFLMAEVEAIDLSAQRVQFRLPDIDRQETLHYDHLILAPGSATKMPPIPGLKEHAFELKSLKDSIEFRDRGIRLLELANAIDDPNERQAFLRIVIVGSNFSGIELAGEYHEFLQDQSESYPNLDPEDVEVVVVEYGARILPAIDADLAAFARRNLERRGLRILTGTTLTEVRGDSVTLTTGEIMATKTTVWCAGITPSPLLDHILELPRDEKGFIFCETTSRVKGFSNVWAIGDSARIADAEGKPYLATAQNASRQGPVAAANILRSLAMSRSVLSCSTRWVRWRQLAVGLR
ncbi:MAG TPA: FAD-dependent oxidoreductase, partial [Terriglobia bacterium]|nr:FAD-dependent oxidoreductase [Terriglobia bacterium]